MSSKRCLYSLLFVGALLSMFVAGAFFVISFNAYNKTHSSSAPVSTTPTSPTPMPTPDPYLDRVSPNKTYSFDFVLGQWIEVAKDAKADKEQPDALFRPLNVPNEDTRTCYNANFRLFDLCSIVCKGEDVFITEPNKLFKDNIFVPSCNATYVELNYNGIHRSYYLNPILSETVF